MKRWLMAALAAVLLGASLATAPAQAAAPVNTAAVINGCDNAGSTGVVCLYNWIDWEKGGGFWRRTWSQMDAYSRNCASLQTHYWDIGGIIYDNPPSSHVAHSVSGSNQVIRFYDWVGCNKSGPYVDMYIPVGGISMDDNLSTTVASNNSNTSNFNWYDRVSSLQLCDLDSSNYVVCE